MERDMARLNVNFSEEVTNVLLYLAERQSCTQAEVLRRAIALEKWFFDTTDRKAKIIIVEPDGSERELLRIHQRRSKGE